MTLTLCLHASARQPRIYLLEEAAPGPAGNDGRTGDPASGPSIAEQVDAVLAGAGRTPREISRIVVDVGPGRLSAVRGAVSFANALAFALDRPILPVVSSRAAGWQAAQRLDLPAVVVHKAAAGAAYVGLVEGARLTRLRHGPLATMLAKTAHGLPAFALVGLARETAEAALPGVDIFDGGDGEITPASFLTLAETAQETAWVRGPVHPVTEQSDEVHD